MHLCDVCTETRVGEVKCPTCGVCHSMKKKGHTHQLLTSPMDLLKRWSVNRHPKPNRNVGSSLAPANNHMQAQEAETAGESDSSVDTDMSRQLELHSKPPRFELQDSRRNIHEAPVEPEKPSLNQTPFHGHIGEPFSYRNVHQNSFAHPSPYQPSMKQLSWSDNSTLFGGSSIHEQDTGKQLSIDTMSIPPSNGSYHNFQSGQAGHNQAIMPNNEMWLSGPAFTESPGGVEPSSQGQAPWQGQTNHLHSQVTTNHAANQWNMPSSHYMTRRTSDSTSLSNAAVEMATNELRRHIGAVMPVTSTPGSTAFLGQAQAQAFPPFGAGNNSCDSYGSNTADEMVIDRPLGQVVESEAMSAIAENTSNHKRILRVLAPTQKHVVKVRKSQRKQNRPRAARKAPGNAAGRSLTPIDELECPYWPCRYRPEGEHKKNYRSHYNRHLLTHDPEAKTNCPVMGCTQEFRGARKDNVLEHLRRMHPDTTLETVENAGTLHFRRQPRRTTWQTANTGVDFPNGTPGIMRSRDQSRTVSGDDNLGAAGMAGTPVTLMGISGDINSNMGSLESSGHLPRAQDGDDYLSQTVPENVMGRQFVLPFAPWTDERQQGFPSGGHDNGLHWHR